MCTCVPRSPGDGYVADSDRAKVLLTGAMHKPVINGIYAWLEWHMPRPRVDRPSILEIPLLTETDWRSNINAHWCTPSPKMKGRGRYKAI